VMNITIGPWSIGIIFNANGTNFEGLTLGLGIPFPLGFSASEIITADMTISEINSIISGILPSGASEPNTLILTFIGLLLLIVILRKGYLEAV